MNDWSIPVSDGTLAYSYSIPTPDGGMINLPEAAFRPVFGPAERRGEYLAQFAELVREIDAFVAEHEAKVARVFITHDRSGAGMTLMTRQPQFNRDFHNAVAAFEIRIAQDERFGMIELSSTVLPLVSETSAASFVGANVVMWQEVAKVGDGE